MHLTRLEIEAIKNGKPIDTQNKREAAEWEEKKKAAGAMSSAADHFTADARAKVQAFLSANPELNLDGSWQMALAGQLQRRACRVAEAGLG